MTAHQQVSVDDAADRLLARLHRPARLLVAMSGGSDSTGLLVALARRRVAGVEVFAVTVDHGLRPESAREAEQAANLCRGLGIGHATRRWIGDKPSTGIAAAAREARYRLLCAEADELDATAILTGHTLDDQIETVMMRAARRCDPNAPGLAGMADAVLLHRRHWLLRPFLQTAREAICDYLRAAGHGWIEDPSNINPASERARTRMALAGSSPLSPSEIEAAACERTRLADAAAAWLDHHAQVRRGVLMHVAPEGLHGDPAVLRYALSTSAAVLGGREQGPSADVMGRVLQACREPATWRMTAGRVVFDGRRSGLYLCRETRDLPPLAVTADTAVLWDGRFRIVPSLVSEALSVPPILRQAAMGLFPGVPSSVAMRAAGSLPPCCSTEGHSRGLACTPILAPFDRFLPQFDHNLASTLAKLIGCDDFPAVPFADSVRKR
ncbi:tRNA lysidine(34) synthetase TilS [Pseudorhizobium endolithicum]|uniref:tRNA(Ile)-lysidine synthase n=1 Tax=Pseudorhizobium endolithicum TaxID=1191678 RepID=A0ABM8PPX3_9HYPH|nr:tRNA lysidine(34) synthetase TilS [Pseudorhizobium endolithicum]CAD7041511.1 tRNA lysidine(34) synthetase TilS [Pseudorhizobium endolithicum]